ncbi:succinylglutamate desuccinylase/aspartoacylase family protein [Colwellia sp. M166]|uniref:succinylglutamate desuccinylase/aspartoacylase family protein n=1 Tax=Colwellia sp. M166 TaxID=2583805 RepID=UPI00211DB78A|nr:succinylglutamate desuccinylase/aspartoacylase family protein [Colwellia sp. M166]UUO24028.1 succinylglutamate desuccinylase/aspartoacylase family protein [Colwellia sp. M166]|tara:strand:- start:59022 stop:60170 length:1149 start_codon:yes stop_codon:yes gene_type:complete
MNVISKEVMHVGEMASGAALTVPVYRIKGKEQGPDVYIQANMHGAEVQGNAVIFQLLEQLKTLELNSSITLVPYANPVACNHKNGEYTLGRFDPITGVNWNRMYYFAADIIEPFAQAYLSHSAIEIERAFKALLLEQIEQKLNHNIYGLTTGQRIAFQLQQLAHQADIVLDLHTGPISSKHLYCPEYAKESAKYFDIPHTLLIPNSFDGALDEATFCPWWQLKLAFAQLGRDFSITKADENYAQDLIIKESFTVELGSQEQIDLDVAHEDAQGILSYLQYQGVIKSNDFHPKSMIRYSCMLADYKALYSPMGGMVDYLAEFGQPLAAGEPLARILRMDNYGDGDPLHYISLDHPVIPILHFASASVNQGTELYKVFSQYSIL